MLPQVTTQDSSNYKFSVRPVLHSSLSMTLQIPTLHCEFPVQASSLLQLYQTAHNSAIPHMVPSSIITCPCDLAWCFLMLILVLQSCYIYTCHSCTTLHHKGLTTCRIHGSCLEHTNNGNFKTSASQAFPTIIHAMPHKSILGPCHHLHTHTALFSHTLFIALRRIHFTTMSLFYYRDKLCMVFCCGCSI